MKLVLSLIAMTIMASCSHYSNRTYTTTGEITFKGGVFGTQTWTDTMTFKRNSWFSEVTMEYDVLLHELKADSKFTKWLGMDDKFIKSCPKLYIGFIYANSYKGKTVSEMNAKLEALGYDSISLVNFEENIKAHSRYNEKNLGQYTFSGYCLKEKENINEQSIQIPGYSNINLK